MILPITMRTIAVANLSPEMTADGIPDTAGKIGLLKREERGLVNPSRASFRPGYKKPRERDFPARGNVGNSKV